MGSADSSAPTWDPVSYYLGDSSQQGRGCETGVPWTPAGSVLTPVRLLAGRAPRGPRCHPEPATWCLHTGRGPSGPFGAPREPAGPVRLCVLTPAEKESAPSPHRALWAEGWETRCLCSAKPCVNANVRRFLCVRWRENGTMAKPCDSFLPRGEEEPTGPGWGLCPWTGAVLGPPGLREAGPSPLSVLHSPGLTPLRGRGLTSYPLPCLRDGKWLALCPQPWLSD